MFYAVRHFTRFRYSMPVWQSAMELRMQPRSENTQRCFNFQLSISPKRGYSPTKITLATWFITLMLQDNTSN